MIDLPVLFPQDQLLLVFEDFSNAPQGGLLLAVGDIQVLSDNPLRAPCTITAENAFGDVIFVEPWIGEAMNPTTLSPCEELTAITVEDQFGNIVYLNTFELGYDFSQDQSNSRVVSNVSPTGENCVFIIRFYYRIQCDDQDPCTVDFCLEGECQHINLCDDNDPCTLDYCDPETGACINEPLVDPSDVVPPPAQPCFDYVGSTVRLNGTYVEGLSQFGPNHASDEGGYIEELTSEEGECVIVATHFYNPRDCAHEDPCMIGTCNPATNDCEYEPSDLDISVTNTPVRCVDDATISTVISGGTPPYTSSLMIEHNGTYSVSIGHEFVMGPGNYRGLGKGSYRMAVTDSNGCVYEETVSISSPDTIYTDTLSVVPATTGTNGAILIEVSGGTPGYEFEWSNGETTQISLI